MEQIPSLPGKLHHPHFLVNNERGLTQAELAQMVDIAPKYLSNIECGVKVSRFEPFIEIANALMVDANTLLVDLFLESRI